MIGRGRLGPVAFRCGFGHEGTDRAGVFAFRRRPVQTVLATGIAEDFHGIDAGFTAITAERGIFLLGIHIATTYGNRTEFVFTDAAIDQLIGAGGGVQIPFIALLGHRNRERPIVRADDQGLAFAIRL